MQPLAQGSYTAAEVRAALTASGRTVDFRYDLLDSSDAIIGELDGVSACTVKHNAMADIKRTAKLTVADDGQVDWLSNRIRPWWRLAMPDGGWVEWPQGVFLPSSPTRQHTATGSVRDVEAYDKAVILEEDRVEDRYVVTAGTVVTTAVAALLTAAGVTKSYVTASTETLPADRDWPPGTSRRRIINDLLRSINYRSLSFDAAGFATSGPYQTPADRATGETYETDDRSVVSPDVAVEFDLFGIANKWVATVSEPDRVALRSVYTNTSATSPTSTVSRGRTIVDLRDVDATSQTALDALVERLAFEASQVYEIVELTTATMPHHGNGDVIEVVHAGAQLDARYTEHRWKLPMAVGATMSHRLRRVVTV